MGVFSLCCTVLAERCCCCRHCDRLCAAVFPASCTALLWGACFWFSEQCSCALASSNVAHVAVIRCMRTGTLTAVYLPRSHKRKSMLLSTNGHMCIIVLPCYQAVSLFALSTKIVVFLSYFHKKTIRLRGSFSLHHWWPCHGRLPSGGCH